MEGIQRIEVQENRVVIVYDPQKTTLEAITSAFYVQGVERIP